MEQKTNQMNDYNKRSFTYYVSKFLAIFTTPSVSIKVGGTSLKLLWNLFPR